MYCTVLPMSNLTSTHEYLLQVLICHLRVKFFEYSGASRWTHIDLWVKLYIFWQQMCSSIIHPFEAVTLYANIYACRLYKHIDHVLLWLVTHNCSCKSNKSLLFQSNSLWTSSRKLATSWNESNFDSFQVEVKLFVGGTVNYLGTRGSFIWAWCTVLIMKEPFVAASKNDTVDLHVMMENQSATKYSFWKQWKWVSQLPPKKVLTTILVPSSIYGPRDSRKKLWHPG